MKTSIIRNWQMQNVHLVQYSGLIQAPVSRTMFHQQSSTEVFAVLHIFHKPCKENPVKNLNFYPVEHRNCWWVCVKFLQAYMNMYVVGFELRMHGHRHTQGISWSFWLQSSCKDLKTTFLGAAKGSIRQKYLQSLKKIKTHWKPGHFKCSMFWALPHFYV